MLAPPKLSPASHATACQAFFSGSLFQFLVKQVWRGNCCRRVSAFTKGLLTQTADLIKVAPPPRRTSPLFIPARSHHQSARVLPQISGVGGVCVCVCVYSQSSTLQEQTLAHQKKKKQYLTDAVYSTVRKRVRLMGTVTRRCDNHLTCPCHRSRASCVLVVVPSPSAQHRRYLTCFGLQHSPFVYNHLSTCLSKAPALLVVK